MAVKLEITNLSLRLSGREILDRIHFSTENTITVILGENGAGKTTLLKTIAGLYAPDGGGIFLDGRNLGDFTARQRARLFSYVPQNCQATGCVAADFVVMGRNPYLKFWQMPGGKEYSDGLAALQALGIRHLAERPMDHLSGGERRLCYLARARIQEAEWMILDEPESGLDFGRRHEFFTQLREYLKKNRKHAIMSLHDPTLADAYGDGILFMKKGRVFSFIHKQEKDYKEQMADSLKRLYGPNTCLIEEGKYRAVIWKGERDADH